MATANSGILRKGIIFGAIMLFLAVGNCVAWVVRVVLVIKFVDAHGLHGLNNQIIEKT